MKDENKTKSQLIRELGELRAQFDEFKKSSTFTPPPNSALTLSQDQFQNILDMIPAYVVIKDTSNRHLFVNKTLSALTGIPKEEWTGKTTAELFPENTGQYQRDDEEVIKTGIAKRNILEAFVSVDGVRWAQTDKIPFKDTNGNIAGVIGVSFDVTELKKIEEQLRVLEMKYRIVTDNTSDWEFWAAPDGNFIYSSPSCKRVTGYDPAEFEDDPDLLQKIIHPEDAALYSQYCQLNQLSEREIEYRIIGKSGIERWISQHCYPVYDEDGTLLGRRGSNRDITSRKETERLLRESEEIARAFMNAITESAFLIDTEGRLITANSTFFERMNKDESEISDIDPTGILPADVAAKRKEQIHEAINSKKIVRFEDTRWGSVIDNTIYPVLNEEGDVYRLAILERDITETKHAVQALRQSEKQYRLLASNFPDGMVILFDRDLRYIIADGTELSKSGLSASDMEGKTIWEIYTPEVYKTLEPYYRSALRGESSSFIMEFNGQIYQLRVLPIRGETNESAAGMTIIQNVTDRMQYEAKLRELNANKDKFFSIIAHDLKSPFTALLGFSEYMAHYLEDLSPDEIKDFSMNIFKSASGVYRLIENLLQWSRLQLGRMDFAPINFDFIELADEMLQLYQANAIKKKVRLEIDLQSGLIAFADKNMIETVIRNLLSNAMKFTNAGGNIKLCAHKRGSFLEVSIIDNGVGISQEDLPKLFKVGDRFSTLGTDQERGTGLGLLLCKEFIEKNGGRITVSSEPMKGSIFTFTVPTNTAG